MSTGTPEEFRALEQRVNDLEADLGHLWCWQTEPSETATTDYRRLWETEHPLYLSAKVTAEEWKQRGLRWARAIVDLHLWWIEDVSANRESRRKCLFCWRGHCVHEYNCPVPEARQVLEAHEAAQKGGGTDAS